MCNSKINQSTRVHVLIRGVLYEFYEHHVFKTQFTKIKAKKHQNIAPPSFAESVPVIKGAVILKEFK